MIEGLSDLVQTSIGRDTITWTYSLTYNADGDGYGTVTEKNADDYEVYIMGIADNHHPYIAKEPVKVTIDKASLKLTIEGKTVEYGYGEPNFEIKNEGFVNGESFESLGVKAEAGTAYTAGSAVGTTYDITVSFDDSKKLLNYDIKYELGKLTVEPRNITITITGNSCDYDSDKTDETDYTESIDWDFSDGYSTYNDEKLEIAFGIESNTYPLTVENSPYVVTYEVTGDYARNYKVTLSNPEFTIKAKAVTVTAGSNNTFSYTGSVPNVNYSVDPEDAREVLSFKYQILIDDESEEYRDIDSPVNVGKYRLVITGSDSTNYTASNTNIDFRIEKADYLELVEGSDIDVVDYHDDYDGRPHLPTVTVTGAEDPYAYGLQWEFYIDDQVTEGITNQTNGSSVTVDIVFSISEKYRDNINAPESRQGTVRIDPLTVDVKWGDTDLTYNGTVQTVSATFPVTGTRNASPLSKRSSTSVCFSAVPPSSR